ncbi:hypothetical protein NDU88_008263 [Pleurodeles waltl]|uniref:Secreted protein n=1 Tax=Pleurodeles waltl TaxID=8319 RepID=A0AAV7VUM7_PLEWA|nr:hypothetical protein NDU88_008263 [Pleurodeles waltl]
MTKRPPHRKRAVRAATRTASLVALMTGETASTTKTRISGFWRERKRRTDYTGRSSALREERAVQRERKRTNLGRHRNEVQRSPTPPGTRENEEAQKRVERRQNAATSQEGHGLLRYAPF